MPDIARKTMLVRRATPQDLSEVTRLHAENFAEAWPESFWHEQIAGARDAAAAPALLYVSAIESDRPLTGMLLARRVADEAELLTLAVERACRRQGVARSLLDKLIGDLRVDLPCRLFLEVSVENAEALALYTNFGFETVGTREGYYRTPSATAVDARVLALDMRN